MNCHRLKFISRPLFATAFLLSAGFGFLTSCNSGSHTMSDEQLREQTAQATEKAKQQSKEVLQDARIAASNAEQKVNDVAAGVQEGVKGYKAASSSRVNLNQASGSELSSLPGISSEKAAQIVRHRPYSSTHDLVDRGLLTQSQFEAISSNVTVQ